MAGAQRFGIAGNAGRFGSVLQALGFEIWYEKKSIDQALERSWSVFAPGRQ